MNKDEELLIALRRVIRAISLHSRQLNKVAGLTSPQLLVIQYIHKHPNVIVRQLAEGINLSPATVTSILDRLETKRLVQRIRSTEDKRRVEVLLTHEGEQALNKAPMLLQEHFLNRFAKLEEWEQSQMVAMMQRMALMMDAQDLDAAAVLEVGNIDTKQ